MSKKAEARQKRKGITVSERDKNAEAFIKELQLLAVKYGVGIDGCGCCDSPALVQLEDGYKPEYLYDKKEAYEYKKTKGAQPEKVSLGYHYYGHVRLKSSSV